MSRIFRISVGLTMAFAILSAGLAGAAEAPKPAPREAGQTAQTARKPRPAVTISKETTFITEPLRADGYPDYVAALNQIASKGVTPQNNSAVPLWQAMGPRELNEKMRGRFFQMLGIGPLPEQGDYFIPLEEYAKQHPELAPRPKTPAEEPKEEPGEAEPPQADDDSQRVWDALDESMKRPWTAKELPLIARWLKVNERPIGLLVEASRRPRRYDPLIGSEDETMVLAVLLPGAQQMRAAARALKARAMLRLGEGRVEDAWADLLAIHRLGRLAREGQTLVEGLVGIAIDGIACQGDNVLMAEGKLTAAQAMKMRGELRGLAPAPSMADMIDRGERFMYLDAVCTIAREGVGQLNGLLGLVGAVGAGEADDLKGILLKWAGRAAIDWDVPLRMGNQWYDRMVEAGRKPTRAERKAALDRVNHDVEALIAKARDPKTLAWALLGNTRQMLSERMGQVFVGLLLPAIGAVFEAEDRGAMTREVAVLGFALAAYRADHGKYPAGLADLVPKYADKLPQDVFSGGPPVYRAAEGGFVLYSVGRNGKDDGGHGYDDRDNSPESRDWDDLVVRVPLKPAAKK